MGLFWMSMMGTVSMTGPERDQRHSGPKWGAKGSVLGDIPMFRRRFRLRSRCHRSRCDTPDRVVPNDVASATKSGAGNNRTSSKSEPRAPLGAQTRLNDLWTIPITDIL